MILGDTGTHSENLGNFVFGATHASSDKLRSEVETETKQNKRKAPGVSGQMNAGAKQNRTPSIKQNPKSASAAPTDAGVLLTGTSLAEAFRFHFRSCCARLYLSHAFPLLFCTLKASWFSGILRSLVISGDVTLSRRKAAHVAMHKVSWRTKFFHPTKTDWSIRAALIPLILSACLYI